MIDEVSFKALCGYANAGTRIRALYIAPNAPSREDQIINMQIMASSQGLQCLYRHKDRILEVGPCKVYLRIAHPYLDRELKGTEWSWIRGLEYVKTLEDGERIASKLAAMVRLCE